MHVLRSRFWREATGGGCRVAKWLYRQLWCIMPGQPTQAVASVSYNTTCTDTQMERYVCDVSGRFEESARLLKLPITAGKAVASVIECILLLTIPKPTKMEQSRRYPMLRRFRTCRFLQWNEMCDCVLTTFW